MMADLTGDKGNPTAIQILERRVRELSTLQEIARAVVSVLDLESVLNRIVEAAVYLTNAEEGFLLLVDEETGDLTLRAGKGLGEKAARGMSMKVTDSIAGQAVKTGRPVRMGGFQRDEKYKVKTGYLVKSLVNVPIKSAGRVIGVLSVDHFASSRSFGDHDVALLSSLADYAAIAIENARLFAEASAKADELAATLQAQAGAAPSAPPPEPDRQALEQFVQGLRAQREEVSRGMERARKLAQDLHVQAEGAEDMAQRLGLWNEEVLGLLPQLEWLARTGLPPVMQPAALSAEGETPPAAPTSESQLFKSLAEGVLLCDATGVIRQANEAAAQILGKPVADLIDLNLQAITDDARWERMVGSLRLALAMSYSGQAVPPVPEVTLYIESRAVHARLIPTYESEVETAGIVAIFHDLSAETEGWRACEELLVSLSRKLRGPMTTIASYSDLLLGDRMGAVDAMQRRYLQRIRQGVERVEAILSDLSEEVQPTGQRIAPAHTHSIAEVIDKALAAAQEILSLDGVGLVKDIGENLPPVQVDAECVGRILADLLTAAGKRTDVGDSVSVSTQVQIADEQPGYLIVLIRDGGIAPRGVPPLDEDELIRAARSLAEDEGGRIWAERKADGHNLLSFLLPVSQLVLRDHLL
jgi:GAF domain-containing protein/signal transduction histidine kinase